MSPKVFSDRFPWKLLNWRSPESQRAWLMRRLPKSPAGLHFPLDPPLLANRWIFLSKNGDGWPAVGNVLSAWPGKTTLFAPPERSSASHFGCTLHVLDPDRFAVGDPVFDELLVRSVEAPPGLVICLEREPSLPLLYLIAKTEAPCRVGFGPEDRFPFFNINIASPNPEEWPALLAKWIRPGPEGRRRPRS